LFEPAASLVPAANPYEIAGVDHCVERIGATMRRFLPIVATAAAICQPLAASGVPAGAAFRAEPREGAIVVYARSDRDRRCTVVTRFTYLEPDGRRLQATHICQSVQVPAGDEAELCRAANERIVQPQIPGELEVTCE
jgi:hypothetical protein